MSAVRRLEFRGQSRTGRYAWIETTLRQQEYFPLGRKQRGAVRALLSKVAGLSLPQITRCVARISEQHLLPVLEAMLHQFPFLIVGFHSDNGSEFVNRTVADLLNKLLVKLTRSRPNRRSDNALVVGKNGAIIRKHIGCGHIATNTPTPSSASIRRTSTRT